MNKTVVHRFRCTDCPRHITGDNPASEKISGVSLEWGVRYCTGGKRARRFRSGDPRVYPPSWCPRRKIPAEYRVYALKDAKSWFLYQMLRRDGAGAAPDGHRCAVRTEGRISLTAAGFQKAVKESPVSDILGVPVSQNEIIEIDDGLRPYFFHLTGKGVKLLFLFDSERAKRNLYLGGN